MIYLLIGYMWLFIHRPYEIWPVLGVIRLEFVYTGFTVLYWALLYPGKCWTSNRINAAFFFFLIAFLLAFLMSPYQSEGLCSKVVEDYLKLVVFYLLVLGSVREEKDLKLLVMGYLGVMALYMTHSLWEFRNGRHVYRMGTPRMVGVDLTYNDPNTFAATIIYSLPLIYCLELPGRREMLAKAAYSGLTVLCVVLTGSRSGFVSLFLLTLLSARRLFRRKLLLLALIASLPLAWSVMPETLQNRFWTVYDPSVGPANAQESAESRLDGLYDGIAHWQKSPIWGLGPASHGFATGEGLQSHNLYGQVLGETGTLGALGFFSMVTCFFLNGWEVRGLRRMLPPGKPPFPVTLTNSILITVVLLLFKGYSDHNGYRYTWLWFGAFQSLATSCMHRRVIAHTRGRRQPSAALVSG